MGKDGIYSAKREVRTFVDLDHGASALIGKSEQDQKGSYYTHMGALLLLAFTFEAYLNHLGNLTFAFWPRIERLRVVEKYRRFVRPL